jgi:hypothetical protein
LDGCCYFIVYCRVVECSLVVVTPKIILGTWFAKVICVSLSTLVVSDLKFAPEIRKQPPRNWPKSRRLFANNSRIIFRRRTDGYSRLKFGCYSLQNLLTERALHNDVAVS